MKNHKIYNNLLQKQQKNKHDLESLELYIFIACLTKVKKQNLLNKLATDF
jgi:hypothetical protein